jgi:hypothetical protein
MKFGAQAEMTLQGPGHPNEIRWLPRVPLGRTILSFPPCGGPAGRDSQHLASELDGQKPPGYMQSGALVQPLHAETYATSI